MIKAVGVAVPAHNEESTLAACLESVVRSAGHPALRGIPIRLVTVLDACRDNTGEVACEVAARARSTAGPMLDITVVEQHAANVGLARAAGCRHLLEAFAGLEPRRVWIATTDADTVVPSDWLAHHVALGRQGADGCAGLVRVADWSQQPGQVAVRFQRSYPTKIAGRHGHVHGANLGFTAEAYLRAGGFQPHQCGEDHALVQAMRRQGSNVVATLIAPVTTSARRESRVVGGFSDTLRRLGGDQR